MESPSARNLTKSVQNQTESGAKPLRGFLILGTLRVEIIQKLSSKLIALRAEIGTYACGILIYGVPYGQKSFKIYALRAKR